MIIVDFIISYFLCFKAEEMDVMIGNIGYDVEGERVRAYLDTLLDVGVFRQFRYAISVFT